jgi:hypothetical protein
MFLVSKLEWYIANFQISNSVVLVNQLELQIARF